MRVFGVGYVHSMLSDFNDEFVGEDKSIKSISDIRGNVERFIEHDLVNNLRSAKGSAVFDACEMIYRNIKNNLSSTVGGMEAPLHGYFKVSVELEISTRSNLELCIGLNSCSLSQKNAVWIQEREFGCSYLSLFKSVYTNLSENTCTSYEEYQALLSDYVNSASHMRDTLRVNLEWRKHQLGIFESKKKAVDAMHANMKERRDKCNERIIEYESDLDTIKKCASTFSSCSVLGISKKVLKEQNVMEYEEVQNSHFKVVIDNLNEKILNEKVACRELEIQMERINNLFDGDISRASGSRLVTLIPSSREGQMTKYSMLVKQIQRMHEFILMLENLMSLNDDGWNKNLKLIQDAIMSQTELELGNLRTLLDVAKTPSGMEGVMMWMKKTIASREMLFEGLFYMSEEVRQKLHQSQ